jgi:hypothetical protein
MNFVSMIRALRHSRVFSSEKAFYFVVSLMTRSMRCWNKKLNCSYFQIAHTWVYLSQYAIAHPHAIDDIVENLGVEIEVQHP